MFVMHGNLSREIIRDAIHFFTLYHISGLHTVIKMTTKVTELTSNGQ